MLAAFFLVGAALTAGNNKEDRVLFNFQDAAAAKQWQSVNDGVMGGRSNGQFRITADKTMDFYGTLSLENNGGFASVRSTPTKLDLKPSDTLVLRVRGDGREYFLNLYVPTQRTAFSYRASFQTKKGEWTEVELPIDKFSATWFGRAVQEKLDPSKVNRLGILLGDKKAGPFRLEVAWIKVKGSPDSDSSENEQPEQITPSEEDYAKLLELTRPSTEHARLKKLAGDWSVSMSAGGKDTGFAGTAKAEMILGDRFLVIDGQGESKGEASAFRYTLGFDRRHGEYTILLIDTAGTYHVAARGKPTADGIRMFGTDDDPYMKKLGLEKKFAFDLDIRSDDAFSIITIYIDTRTKEEKLIRAFTHVFTRAKPQE